MSNTRAAAGLRAGPALAMAIFLGGCELGYHRYQQATAEGCEPWRQGCSVVLDYTGRGPINAPGVDVDRVEIVAAAADAPYRPCETIGVYCQGRNIGDVLIDQYAAPLVGESERTSETDSAQASAGAVEPAPAPPARSRIVRTDATEEGSPAPAASRVIVPLP